MKRNPLLSKYVCIMVMLMTLLITGCKNWNRIYGFGFFYCVEQTSDGGYIAGGWQEILKVNAQGIVQWKKSLIDWNSKIKSTGTIVHQTQDGGYIAVYDVGEVMCWECVPTFVKSVLIKLNAKGKKEWEKAILDTDGTELEVSSVQQTADGGYILSGDYYIDGSFVGVLVKTDSSGIYQWTQVFESFDFRAWENPAGGYSLIGWLKNDPAHLETMIVRTDIGGAEVWRKIYGEVLADSFCATDDGGAVLATQEVDNGNAVIHKIDADGENAWNRVYPHTGKADGMGFLLSVEQTSDHGYLIAGRCSNEWGWNDSGAWVVRADQDGNETSRWRTDFGTKPEVHVVRPTLDGGYIIAGYILALNQAWIGKTDEKGKASDW